MGNCQIKPEMLHIRNIAMDIYRPLKFLLFFSMLTIVSSHAAASFCSGITSTTWIANAGASDVFCGS